MKNNKKAFTLVELLIAMFLFAMLAVLLVPNVTRNAEKELFATQIKKVQNDVQQAMLLMMSQNQGTLQSFCFGDSSSKCFRDEISKHLEKKVTMGKEDIAAADCDEKASDAKNPCKQKQLYTDRDPIFINKSNKATYNVNNKDHFYAVNLMNGATVSVVFNPACDRSGIDGALQDQLNAAALSSSKICGYMEIDTNASKVPNTVGKDIHYFWIVDKDGIVPFGEIDNFTCSRTQKTADKNASLGCTYRLMRVGKIDYY